MALTATFSSLQHDSTCHQLGAVAIMAAAPSSRTNLTRLPCDTTFVCTFASQSLCLLVVAIRLAVDMTSMSLGARLFHVCARMSVGSLTTAII